MRAASGPFTGALSTHTSPRVSFRKPPRMLSIVDLPQPDGPTRQTNSPGRTWKLTRSSTSMREPFSFPGNDIHASRTWMSGLPLSITPANFVELFQLPQEHVEHEAYQSNHHHAGDDEVVALAGVARVNDEIAKAGTHGDHFRRHDHEPRHAKCDTN